MRSIDDSEDYDLSTDEIAKLLTETVEFAMDEGELPPHTECVPFASAGVLTSNGGFVLRLAGAEYQITVVRSR